MIEQSQIFKLLAELTGNKNTVALPMAFVKMLDGDVTAAYLLSQLIYWSPRCDDKEGWIYKTYQQWQEEIGLSAFRVKRAVSVLKPFGVETRTKKHKGAPTLHYRINPEVFLEALKTSIFKKLENEETSVSENEETSQSENEETSVSIYTETTTETTTETKEITAAPKVPGAATDQQAMFEAVCKAWGYALDKLTPSKKKDVGLVASELVSGHARPDQIPAFKEWLDAKAKADDWKSYTVFAMKKWWPDYAATLPPEQPTPGELVDDPLYDHQYDGKTFLEIQDMKLQKSLDLLASLKGAKL